MLRKLKVNTYKLNLRDNPSVENSLIIGVMSKGEVLEILSFTKEYKWAQIKRENGQVGFCSYKYCIGVANPDDIRINDYKWLKIGFGEKETAELADPDENSRITTYLNTCDHLSEGARNSDETAWCSAYMNWCVETAGYPGTNSAWALSWKNWGREIPKRRGSIAVFKRFKYENGVKLTFGHVGFYLGMVDGMISILGGNQSDSVCVQKYPVQNDDYEFLGCRTI